MSEFWNPFSAWTRSRQCFGSYARKKTGGHVETDSPEAKRFCALGWLRFCNAPPEEIYAFSSWIYDRHKHDVVWFNDVAKLPPEWFAAQWEEWSRGPKLSFPEYDSDVRL